MKKKNQQSSEITRHKEDGELFLSPNLDIKIQKCLSYEQVKQIGKAHWGLEIFDFKSHKEYIEGQYYEDEDYMKIDGVLVEIRKPTRDIIGFGKLPKYVEVKL